MKIEMSQIVKRESKDNQGLNDFKGKRCIERCVSFVWIFLYYETADEHIYRLKRHLLLACPCSKQHNMSHFFIWSPNSMHYYIPYVVLNIKILNQSVSHKEKKLFNISKCYIFYPKLMCVKNQSLQSHSKSNLENLSLEWCPIVWS